eukprot:1153234-Pelagomonas_calceolata.AAC.2
MLRQSAKRLHALVADEILLERLASGKLASSSSSSTSVAAGPSASSSTGLLSVLSSLRQQGGLFVRRGVHNVAKHQPHGPSLPLRPGLFIPAQVKRKEVLKAGFKPRFYGGVSPLVLVIATKREHVKLASSHLCHTITSITWYGCRRVQEAGSLDS